MAKIDKVSPLAPAVFPDLPAVAGVRWATLDAGIRYKNRHDLTLIELARGSSVAGVFTRSLTAGHPVLWCRRLLSHGRARAMIVNAGNANVFRGAEGDRAVEAEAAAVAKALGCGKEEVFVASTGVIGERLPVEKITGKIEELVAGLDTQSAGAAARAIMTTDTYPKGAQARAMVEGAPVTIVGIAKGSGMIAPDMATLLAFVVTDARIEAPALQALLADGAERSFNCITVDSDTSTSDTLLLFATRQAAHCEIADPSDSRLAEFRQALDNVLLDLALQVVRDGEGAQKLIAVTVKGAVTDASAKRIGLSVANSPLVKTAIAGGDANWGRIVMAVGKAGEPIDTGALEVSFGGHVVAKSGGAVPNLVEAPIAAHLRGQEIVIEIGVGQGQGRAIVWTCDLTHAYIDINADYRS